MLAFMRLQSGVPFLFPFQVFQNLSILEKKVSFCLSQQLRLVKERLSSSLDVAKITKGVEDSNAANAGRTLFIFFSLKDSFYDNVHEF